MKIKKLQDEVGQLMMQNLALFCKIYGWDVSFSKDSKIKYIIVGQPKEVKRIIKKLEE